MIFFIKFIAVVRALEIIYLVDDDADDGITEYYSAISTVLTFKFVDIENGIN